MDELATYEALIRMARALGVVRGRVGGMEFELGSDPDLAMSPPPRPAAPVVERRVSHLADPRLWGGEVPGFLRERPDAVASLRGDEP